MTGITIERDSHSQQFVTVHNRVARDKRLKRASRGLLVEVLSMPPGTATTPEVLAEGGPEGRDALRSMIAELEKYGYVVRKKGQDERGRWYTRLIFRENPATDDAFSGVGESGVGKPGAKNLKDEQPKDGEPSLRSVPSPRRAPRASRGADTPAGARTPRRYARARGAA